MDLAIPHLVPYFPCMRARDHSEMILFKAFQQLVAWAAPRAVHDLLEVLGEALGRSGLYRGGLVRRQLACSFPELSSRELDDLTLAVFRHLGRTAGEVFRPGPREDLRHIDLGPGWGELDAALSSRCGAIIASGHAGNFELAGALVAERYPLLDVVKPQRNRAFDEFINERRARRGILTVPMDRSGLSVLRHLRSGGVVSLLLDQDAGKEGVPVEFLGRKASTWPGAARLSLRTGCPVVPLVLQRKVGGGHRLSLGPALWPAGPARDEETVNRYLQDISRSVEELILRHPEQWFWVHRRWKNHHREVATT